MQYFSELFWTGVIVSIVTCILKAIKLCIYNLRQVECFGIKIYDSELLPNRIQSDSNASSNNSSYSINGINPMRIHRPTTI